MVGERGRRVVGVASRRLREPRWFVVAVVVLAFAVRLPLLGRRVAHWDEARVAWWVLRYQETGWWRYFPILHGPFLFHVERWLFEVLGPSDTVMRLPTVVVGGLLPASALWYRDHLDDRETMALAMLLAVAPLLVFYSRFMRNDLLLSAFAFAGFGAFVRARATGLSRYALAGAFLLALGFTTKENAVLYLLSWAGALGLLAAWQLRRGSLDNATLVDRFRRGVGRWWATAVVGVVGFLAVIVWFYAPRTRKPASGIDDVAAHPDLLPGLAMEATVGSARRLVDLWVVGGLGEGTYPEFLALLVGMLLATAPTTMALAVYGTYREHASKGPIRPLVSVALLWGLLGIAGYPAAVDVVGGWTLVHVVIAFTVPAAVGLAALVDRARPVSIRLLPTAAEGTAGAPERGSRVAVVALVVLSLHVGVVGGTVNYAAPGHHWNPYPQPAQPSDDLRPTVDAVAAIAADHPGTDVAYVGPYFAGGVHRRLPLPWYVARNGGTSTLVDSPTELESAPPPIVVAPGHRHDEVSAELSDYVCVEHRLSAWTDRSPGGPDGRTHVYVEKKALDRYWGSTLSSQRCG